MSDKKRLTATVEHGQNQMGVINRELRPMVIRVTNEDGEPASYARVDIHRMDEGQGRFELVDQVTDQSGNAAALYVPAEMTTGYEIEFRVINGDDSSAAVVFTGCVSDPSLDEAVELPVTLGLTRTGRSIHPRADVPELNPAFTQVNERREPDAALADSWYSNESAPDKDAACSPEKPDVVAAVPEAIPPDPVIPTIVAPPIVSAVLAAPVVPMSVPRSPPRPRPVPTAVSTAKAAVAHRHHRPRVVALPPRRHELSPRKSEMPLSYLIAAAVVMWVFVTAGFLAMLVAKPASFKNGRAPDARSSASAPAYAMGDNASDAR